MPQSHEEHNEKNERDQESVTKHKPLQRKRRLELIDALIESQFQPLIFSAQNPLLGAIRPFIETLREQTRITAYSWSDIAGHQEGMANSYWLAAEKYVNSLGVWAAALSPSEGSPEERSGMLHELQAAFPLQQYSQLVWELAYEMWKGAGYPYFRGLEFWVSAERHILTIAGQLIATASNVPEAIGSLTRMVRDFVGDAYLSNIRNRAYYIWKAYGERGGHALEDWLEAEDQALTLGKG